ncbi:signal peptidase complex-like protein DTM1 [Aristolochia californica]|uniref:signal peptidase complex-like protein DTM1 n=1 Tax=Aristolochia californica TaxID=171875 RepID=UPI0035D670CE
MGSDAVLRSSLVFLAALVVLVGFCTFSLKKMFATYVFGLLAIAGVVLPDWEFFDRDFKEWFSPLPFDKRNRNSVGNSTAIRFKLYPGRLVLYTTIYSFGLYKWWKFITN